MNLKRIGVFTVLLLAVVGASASLHFDRKAKYRIECNHVAGGIGVGSVHNQSTPVFYVVDGKSEDDLLWYILEVSEGKYLLTVKEEDQSYFLISLNTPAGEIR